MGKRAILLGDWQSFNDIYGTTNNPWDLGRVPGGSSGVQPSRLPPVAALELSSDIGASIRIRPLLRGLWT